MNKHIVEKPSPEGRRKNTGIGFIVGMLLGGLVDLITGDMGIWTILGMILGSFLGYSGLGHLYLMEYPKGILLKVALAGILFFATLFATYLALSSEALPYLHPFLPYVPLLPGIVFLLALGYAISRLDELQRRIQTEAIAIGFGITAIISLTIGLLGLSSTTQPSWTLVPLIMAFSWLAGKLWTRWKYR
jgi:hypothetical protein